MCLESLDELYEIGIYEDSEYDVRDLVALIVFDCRRSTPL